MGHIPIIQHNPKLGYQWSSLRGVTFYILLHKELSVPWSFCRGQTSAAHIICICMLQTSLYLEGDISPSSSSFAIYFRYISWWAWHRCTESHCSSGQRRRRMKKRKLLKISFGPQYKNIAKLSYRKWKKTLQFPKSVIFRRHLLW